MPHKRERIADRLGNDFDHHATPRHVQLGTRRPARRTLDQDDHGGTPYAGKRRGAAMPIPLIRAELGEGFNRFASGRMGGACPAPGMTASCHPGRVVNRLARCMPLPAAIPPEANRALRRAHTSS